MFLIDFTGAMFKIVAHALIALICLFIVMEVVTSFELTKGCMTIIQIGPYILDCCVDASTNPKFVCSVKATKCLPVLNLYSKIISPYI